MEAVFLQQNVHENFYFSGNKINTLDWNYCLKWQGVAISHLVKEESWTLLRGTIVPDKEIRQMVKMKPNCVWYINALLINY